MQKGTLPFHYAEENESTGMTALSGLPAYLDLAAVARLGESVRRHVGAREGTQGWTDAQMVTSLVMLNLSGGESVDDLRLLERDEGLGRVPLEHLTQALSNRPPECTDDTASNHPTCTSVSWWNTSECGRKGRHAERPV